MSAKDIEPRSPAAEHMREALDYAEWIQTESEARGRPLSWDAAVTAGTVCSLVPYLYVPVCDCDYEDEVEKEATD